MGLILLNLIIFLNLDEEMEILNFNFLMFMF
jgi:hypothetical protein